MKVARRFPLKTGIVAANPRAWGAEFDVLVFAAGAQPHFTKTGSYAVVDICSPLEQHSNPFFDSYEDIKQRVAAALASEQPAVCLRISSPGGDFAGSIELSRELRGMAAAAGKPLVAFTDCQAASAAYALACAADRIVITESAFVGSIGVWAALVDETARDKAMGLNVAIVASGERKVDHNPHVPLTEGAIAAAQIQVDAMASMFFDLVSAHRGMSRSDVEALQGSEQFGKRAVALRLADEVVVSWDAFVSREVVSQTDSPDAQAKGASNMANYDEALAAMRKAAEGDDEDAKAAKAALKAALKANLKALDDEEEPKAEGDEEGDKKEAAKAKAEGDDKKKEDESAKAYAMSLARELHELKASLTAKAESEERATLLATRPDFDDTVRNFLAKQPIESVREAVTSFPRAVKKFAPAAASQAMPTIQGETQGDFSLDDGASALIAKAMGTPMGPGKFYFGCGDIDAARRYLDGKRKGDSK